MSTGRTSPWWYQGMAAVPIIISDVICSNADSVFFNTQVPACTSHAVRGGGRCGMLPVKIRNVTFHWGGVRESLKSFSSVSTALGDGDGVLINSATLGQCTRA